MEGLRAGFDLGGTKLTGVLVGPDGEAVACRTVPSPSHGTWVASAVLDLLSRLLEDLGAGPGDVGFLGMGVPALVDLDERLHGATHVAGMSGQALLDELRSAGSWGAHIDNDVNCSAVAAIHAGENAFVLVSLGTGVGGAIVREGRLERGAHGFAGEIGHMVVVVGGEECGCGKRGCLEAYASGRALTRRVEREFAKGRLPELADPARPGVAPTAKAVVEAWRDLDVAEEIVTDFAYFLAVGISNLVEIGDHAKVLIGGGVSASLEHFYDLLREQYRSVMPPSRLRHDLPIEPVPYGPLAGAIGAAFLDSHRKGSAGTRL
ncbi:MAG: ROK family protein [Actinomycetota bacterium]|nr:ROK family protein [Actinomycetota bacterium]